MWSCLARKTLIALAGVSLLGLSSCGGGGGGDDPFVIEPPSNCEAIGQRFTQEYASIPRNSGICAMFRGELALYQKYRPHASCFQGGVTHFDRNIAQAQEGVRASCEGPGPGDISNCINTKLSHSLTTTEAVVQNTCNTTLNVSVCLTKRTDSFGGSRLCGTLTAGRSRTFSFPNFDNVGVKTSTRWCHPGPTITCNNCPATCRVF